MVENCYKRRKAVLNPIIDWTDRDVWDYIHSESIPYCSLYDEGFARLGCIGCPMGRRRQREIEFMRWPKYKNAYLMAFEKMLEERVKRNKVIPDSKMGYTPKSVFNWWMEYGILPGQINLFEDYEEDDD